ncbi:unnamed protein product [Adineta ricciae]|uniref:Uncharacterized protein n=1 Tax=Adineta ricciae TaxID=249248 RepID=A0A816DPV8_ADIRI|nr:unnamed protein product [Adineta ricciae]CAF1637552.1 unnamed protein product [Adineta ricciae]
MSRAVRLPTFRANLNAEFVRNPSLSSHYVQVIRCIDQYKASEVPNYKFPESNDQLHEIPDIDDESEIFGEKIIKIHN